MFLNCVVFHFLCYIVSCSESFGASDINYTGILKCKQTKRECVKRLCMHAHHHVCSGFFFLFPPKGRKRTKCIFHKPSPWVEGYSGMYLDKYKHQKVFVSHGVRKTGMRIFTGEMEFCLLE